MRFPQDFLFFQLKQKFPLKFIKRNNHADAFGRPVIYEKEAELGGNIIVLDAERLLAFSGGNLDSDCLIVCSDPFPRGVPIPECSVLCVDVSVSLIHLFNEVQQICNLFDWWDAGLQRVFESGSYSEMIDCCDPIICDPISLTDESFRYIGYSKKMSAERGFETALVDDKNSIPLHMVNNIITDRERIGDMHSRDIYISPPIGDLAGDMMLINLYHQDQYVGKLGIKLASNENARVLYNRAILKHLYFYINKLYQKTMSFNIDDVRLNSLRGMILDGLEHREIREESWNKSLEENAWVGGDRLQMVKLIPNHRYDKKIYAKYYCTEIEKRWQGCACIESDNQIYMLVNLDRFCNPAGMDFHQSMAYFLRENLLVGGMSRMFFGADYLYYATLQADIALEIGVRLSPSFWYYQFNDYALPYMISLCSNTMGTERICSEKLLALQEYDEAKHTEYYRTLEIYFECRFNASAASEKLCIQRSSFLKRLQRIREMTGIDLESNEELLYCSMSFHLMRQNRVV
ncbi:MAG: helix-turn-helix domain-containing protein [Anaerofustis sp.]